MTTFQVTLDLSRLETSLRSPSGLGGKILRTRAARVAARAEQLAPGSMARQITTYVQGTSAYVVSNHFASGFVVRGTRPHIIRPRNRKALRFQASGRVVFATIVHHPGNKANNFLLEALRDAL